MSSPWDDSHAPTRHWRGGAWSVELRDDEFAEVRFDGRRVLRSIRAVVRDRNWATAALVIDRIEESGDTLTLFVRSEGLSSSFAGVVRAEAHADVLRVTCDLESAEPFETNRTGLVVLHPHQVAGNDLAVTHTDRTTIEQVFPRAISPHQPVFDIAGLAWTDDGLGIDVRFDGDVFEMEDQRNWSDASFKTYSRPLALPFPYAVEAGERVVQTITVAVSPRSAATPTPTGSTTIALNPTGTRFPEVLVAASTAPDPAPEISPTADGLVVELDLGSANWRAALERALGRAQPIDLRVVLPPHDVAETLDELFERVADADLCRIAAFDPVLHVTDATAASALREALPRAARTVAVIGGARSHFTEYNREHARVPEGLDGVVIATTPMFHSLGTEQLVESLSMQRLIITQTVDMAGGVPVHVGPIALRPRFNNVATVPEPAPTRADLSEGYGAEFTGLIDPRQSSPELAAWTVASAAALAVPGVASIAWFEEWGPRGIRSSVGDPHPVHAAVTALAALGADELLSGTSPDGLVWAVGARSHQTDVVLVANLDDRRREITVVVAGGERTVDVNARTWVRLDAS